MPYRKRGLLSLEASQSYTYWSLTCLFKFGRPTCCPYLPVPTEVNQSTHFEKLLRNLRPGYDWIPEAAAAAGGGDSNGQQQQQQQARTGHWERRVIDEELLRKCNMDPKQVKVRTGGRLGVLGAFGCLMPNMDQGRS